MKVLTRGAILKVCVCATRDLADRGYVGFAKSAVSCAGHAVRDMGDFAASPFSPAARSAAMVREADVCVVLAGNRYGDLVPGRGHLSYVQLEVRTAVAHRKPLLVFFVDDGVPCDQPLGDAQRQAAFRRYLERDLNVTVAKNIGTPMALRFAVFQALVELP